MKQKSVKRREHVDVDSNAKRLVDRRIAKSLQDYKGGRENLLSELKTRRSHKPSGRRAR